MPTTTETPFSTPPPSAGGEQAREIALLLAKAAAASKGYHFDHPLTVARLSHRVGMELGMGDEALEALLLGALVHDVGKLGVPETVLHKSGPLSPRERQSIERHPEIGASIVGQIWCLRRLAPVVRVIRHHHERYDGSGYPDGLQAEEIPLPARIVAATDAYDAMISRRIYRERSQPPTEAIRELRSSAGSHFDAQVVEALERVVVVR